MKTIDVFSLPQIEHALIFSCNKRHKLFKVEENNIEILYVSSGELHIEINGEHIAAKQNDIVCVPLDRAGTVWSDDFYSHHTVCVHVDYRYSDSPLGGLYLPPLIPCRKETLEIRELIDSFITGPYYYEESNAKLVYQILLLLTKIDECCRKNADVHIPKPHLIAENAKKYIHRHIYEPIKSAQIADHLGISPTYLSTVFREAQGCTLMQYINTVKLEAISRLMKKEHVKLYEAAALFGYNDPNYVSRLYKKLFRENITSKKPEQ